jgi:hypothetical protein
LKLIRQLAARSFLLFSFFGFGLALAPSLLAANIDVTYNTLPCDTSACTDVPLQAQQAFNDIASLYGSALSSNATVYVEVQFGTTSLGQSDTQYTSTTYSSWRTALANTAAANPGSAAMASAVASLPADTDPLTDNLNSTVQLTTANAQVLGLGGPSSPQQPNSVITFSTGVNFEYTGTSVPGEYDFTSTAEHELDEVLGIGSSLTGDGSPVPSSLSAEDYFRYSGPGTRAVTNDPNAIVYFSNDGGNTLLAQFNQKAGSDLNDWSYFCQGPPGPFVQDAQSCPGEVDPSPFAQGSPESTVLASLGWAQQPFAGGGVTPPTDTSDVPEPATIAITGLGLALSFARRRKRAL